MLQLRTPAILVLTSFTITCFAQTPTLRDTQGLQIISQSIAAAGGPNLLQVHDVVGTGTITYFWAGKQVQGPVTVKARGTSQFRVDADLPSGTRSWYVSDGQGALRDAAGKTSTIPYQNAATLGALTFPVMRMVPAQSDSSVGVTFLGFETVRGHDYQAVQVSRPHAFTGDFDGTLNRLFTATYLFDPQTFLLSAIQDKTHSINRITEDVDHELDLDDFRAVDGVQFPFKISERIAGQQTFVIQLTAVSLNNSLSDSDFKF